MGKKLKKITGYFCNPAIKREFWATVLENFI